MSLNRLLRERVKVPLWQVLLPDTMGRTFTKSCCIVSLLLYTLPLIFFVGWHKPIPYSCIILLDRSGLCWTMERVCVFQGGDCIPSQGVTDHIPLHRFTWEAKDTIQIYTHERHFRAFTIHCEQCLPCWQGERQDASALHEKEMGFNSLWLTFIWWGWSLCYVAWVKAVVQFTAYCNQNARETLQSETHNKKNMLLCIFKQWSCPHQHPAS